MIIREDLGLFAISLWNMKQPYSAFQQTSWCQPVLWTCFFNACLCFYVEFQIAFFPLFHLWLFLSGCWCNSTLCLRLDTSQSVSLKQKKTFIRYKIAASVFSLQQLQAFSKTHFIYNSLLLVFIHHKNVWHFILTTLHE